MAIRIQNNRMVRLAYRLTDTNGRVIEDRTPETAFEYIQGKGQILPSIEQVVEGRTAGFRAELQVSPREAYGEYDPTLVVEMPRAKFPHEMNIHIGMKFNTTGPQGKPVTVRIVAIDEQHVTIDGNHPLAGLDLIFELRVLDVSEGGNLEAADGALADEFGHEVGRALDDDLSDLAEEDGGVENDIDKFSPGSPHKKPPPGSLH